MTDILSLKYAYRIKYVQLLNSSKLKRTERFSFIQIAHNEVRKNINKSMSVNVK